MDPVKSPLKPPPGGPKKEDGLKRLTSGQNAPLPSLWVKIRQNSHSNGRKLFSTFPQHE